MDGINTQVVDVIDQRSRDVIGGLSVNPSFYWLYTVIGAFRSVFC